MKTYDDISEETLAARVSSEVRSREQARDQNDYRKRHQPPIIQALKNTGTGKGFTTGAAVGYTVGTIAGQLAGGAVGAVTGAATGVAKRATYVPPGLSQSAGDLFTRYGVWLSEKMVAQPSISHEDLKKAFITNFMKKSRRDGTTRAGLAAWFEDNIKDVVKFKKALIARGNDEVVPPSNPPSIRATVRRHVSNGAQVAGSVVGLPLTVAGGIAGAYVGVIWDMASIAMKILTGGKAAQSHVARASWLMQYFEDHVGPNKSASDISYDGQIKQSFLNHFVRRTSAFTSTVNARERAETQWFDRWAGDLYTQYVGFKRNPESMRGYQRNRARDRYERRQRYKRNEHWANKQGNRYQANGIAEDAPMKTFEEIVDTSTPMVDDSINEQFTELFSEAKTSNARERMREWLFDKLQNSDIPHDVLKQAFLDKFGKSKGELFEKLVNTYFEM